MVNTRPSLRMSTPLPARSVPSASAVTASSGMAERSPTTAARAWSRSNPYSPAFGCRADDTVQSLAVGIPLRPYRGTRLTIIANSCQRPELPQDPRRLVRQAADHEGGMELAVADEHGGDAEQDIERRAHQILRAIALEMRHALQQRVHEIEDEGERQQPEEPLSARQEILFVTTIFVDVVGEQQRAQEIQEDRITDEEEIDLIGPVGDPLQPELPPPEMAERDQHEQHPAEMHPVHALALRMLHEARRTREQPGDAEPERDAHDDADVRKDRGRNSVGRHGRLLLT